MSGVDDRIVNMQFNNSSFERGVSTTMGTLAKLKQSLSFGNKNGFDTISKSADGVNLGKLSSAVDGISKKFSAMSIVAITALTNIVNKAVNAGLNVAKSFTVRPIIDGYKEYETKLTSVQTILANTAHQGTNLKQVGSALDELNRYADKTIYNFGEMVSSVKTFTTAGVDLKTSVSSIKGLSNVTAIMGVNSVDASRGMFQLSQALSSGTVRLQDWMSVEKAGFGGKLFQDELMRTARVQGIKVDEMVKKAGSFRASLKDNWLSAKVLTSTLKKFTGELTDAQLKQMGYSQKQIAQIQKQAKTALSAAQDVKSFSALMDTLKEAVGSGWATTFETLFGDVEESKKLWTGVSNSIGGMINKSADARNKLVKDWKVLGGRTALIQGVRNAFSALGSIMKPIKEAFRDIFPKQTAEGLYALTVRFRDFMEQIKIGPETADKLRRTFRGIFALFSIGKQVISEIFGMFSRLFGIVGKGSGGFLSVTASIGDFITAIDKAIFNGAGLHEFFVGLGDILSKPLKVIGKISTALGGIFDGFKMGNARIVSDSLGAVGSKLSGVSNLADKFGKKVGTFFANVADKARAMMDKVVDFFSGFGEAVAKALGSNSFNGVMDILKTGLFAGILLALRKFMSGGIKIDVGGGMFGKIGGILDGLTGNLKAMQQQVKAKTLLMIAGALGLLTISVVALSMIDSKKLADGLKAMAIGFASLLGSMAILTKITGAAGIVKLPAMAAAMVLLALSIDVLAVAVKVLSTMSWDELKRGLTGVGVLLAEVTLAAILISKNSKSMIAAGLGITAMAVGINILAVAVKIFATMQWVEIAKGLAAVGGTLLVIALGMRLMPKSMLTMGIGLAAISLALNGLFLVVFAFSRLDFVKMGKGLLGVVGALAAIAIGMRLMPKGMLLQAAALVVLAGALTMISLAILAMGKMKVSTLAKGIGSIAAILLVLAGAMHIMQTSLVGAAALILVTAAIAGLALVVRGFASMSWSQLIKGVIGLAASLGILVAAGLLLAPLGPALLAIGAAIFLIGAGIGIATAGVGVLLIGIGALVAGGSAGIAVLMRAFAGIISQIPALGTAFAKALVNILLTIGKNGPAIVKGFGAILGALLTVIIEKAPVIAKALGVVLTNFLKFLVDNAPKIVAAGFRLLLDFLKGIQNNIGKVVTTVASIIVKFLQALGSNIGKIIDAGAVFIVKFLNGIADAIDKHMGEILKAGFRIGKAILSGLANAFGNIGGWLWGKVKGAFSGLVNSVKSFFGINSPSTVFYNIGGNIIAGLAEGLKEAAKRTILGGIAIPKQIMGSLIAQTAAQLGIHSPSTVYYDFGKNIIQGLANGLTENETMVETSMSSLVSTMLGISDNLGNTTDFNPVITPVLDLSNIQKDASKISGLMGTSPITAIGSYNQAQSVSAMQQAAIEPSTAQAVSGTTPNIVKFEQNNYSPKALSEAEIYRQTKNQVALAVEALTK